MKILWLCNIMLPKVSRALSLPEINTGGWLTGISNDLLALNNISIDKLLNYNKINLCVCFPQNISKSLMSGTADDLSYYAFPPKSNLEHVFKKIISEFVPDIIHIFGTEYKHTYDMMRILKSLNMTNKTILSIQGIISIISQNYYLGLPPHIIHAYTLRDIIKGNIYADTRKLIQKSKYEISAISQSEHIIGRTDADKAFVMQINPNAKYHFCNETLRNEFYKNHWDINNCNRYSIFVSQYTSPLKGFHIILKEMSKIIQFFPDSHLYTTGKDPFKLNIKDKLKQTSYNKYIAYLIKKYDLTNHITFLGNLNEKQMCNIYLKSHVFVSASSIENSPNSLGEAMLLGVPSVSSDVGGVKNMLTHGIDGFIYPYNESYMLTHYISQIFKDDKLALKFSKNASTHASITHNKETNINTLIKIYNDISY